MLGIIIGHSRKEMLEALGGGMDALIEIQGLEVCYTGVVVGNSNLFRIW